MIYFFILEQVFRKNLLSYLKFSTLKFFQFKNFAKKKKKKEKKNCLNLEQKLPYLCILGWNFKTNLVMFEISTLIFVKLQNFVKKNCLNCAPKMPYLDIFWHEF